MKDHFKKLAGLAAAALAVAVLAGPAAQAQSPANKFAASGSTRVVFGPNTETTILTEQVKMPTNHELALSVSAECSILTALKLGDDDTGAPATDTDSATGNIDVWIEIDGRRVGVTSSQAGDDRGEVTFCNRTHTVRLTDSETQGMGDPMDGIDTLEEYQESKTSAAFNWFALNVGNGGFYDDPANGNNILDIVVKARLESTPNGAGSCQLGDKSCSQAVIGNRTLIAEPTHASVVEVVEENGPDGT